MAATTPESVFTWGAPPLKFGPGAVDELAHELGQFDARRVLVVTDPGVAATGVPAEIVEQLTTQALAAELFDQVHVEPTDESFAAAAEAAGGTDWDAFVAVGGGSVIDTAKAVNLLTTQPGTLIDYVNPPIGEGRKITEPLRPLIAVPTTAGTGAESTPVCVMDILGLKVKTGISHPSLRPSLAVVDPTVTMTLPPEVTAASGMDVLCHALESYTARPYTAFARKQPQDRVAYCGSNPVSDSWAEQALSLLARSFRRAVLVGGELRAREDVMLAATFAGMGFGNAGVHVPHACAYPIAGRVRDYRPAGYPDEVMVPHGQSVSLTAPAAFRFTFPTDADRHLRAAALLDPTAPAQNDPRDQLPFVLTRLMQDIGIPNGIGAVGFDEADVPDLVDGAMQQQRLLNVAPRPVASEGLAGIFRESLRNW